jgi:arylsulfatase A-like enzyme
MPGSGLATPLLHLESARHLAGRTFRRAPIVNRSRWLRMLPLALLLVTTSCGGPATPRHGRLVALVVMDTVRRDHVTPCGSTLPTTPNLEALARESTVFCNMVAPGSWTLPVHASIFTGLLPIEHGADFDASGRTIPGAEVLTVSGLPESIPTLAEAFRDAGWNTALLSANPVLHPSTGLTRGFSEVWVAQKFFADEQGGVVDRVNRFLDAVADPGRPLFLVVNLIAAHGPYQQVPEGLSWLPATPQDLDLFAGMAGSLFADYERGNLTPAQEESLRREVKVDYAWAVHRSDAELGEVLASLRKHGWTGADSLLVVTSDHGELLGEHHLLDHGRTVDPEDIDVFAVLHGPGFPAGSRDTSLVQSQDLFPTLLAAAGLAAPPASRFRVPLTATRTDRVAVSFSEPDIYWAQLTEGHVGTLRMVAVQSASARAVWSREGAGEEGAAPAQISKSGTAAEAETLAQLAARLGALPRRTGTAIPADEDLAHQLRALGYVQ